MDIDKARGHDERVKIFREWAVREASSRRPDCADYYSKSLISDVEHLVSSADGIDHAFLVGGYPCWGPMADEFEKSDAGPSEYAILTSPYGHMPKFNPEAIHVQECPVDFYGFGSNPYIVTPRDIHPGTPEWEWFEVAFEYAGQMRVDQFSALLPERSKYALAYEYQPYTVGLGIGLIPRAVIRRRYT